MCSVGTEEKELRNKIKIVKNYGGCHGTFEQLKNADLKFFHDIVYQKIRFRTKLEKLKFKNYDYLQIERIECLNEENTFMDINFKSDEISIVEDDLPYIFDVSDHENDDDDDNIYLEYDITNFSRDISPYDNNYFPNDKITMTICRYIYTANPAYFETSLSCNIPRFMVVFDTDIDTIQIKFREIQTIESYGDLINILKKSKIIPSPLLTALNNRIKLHALIDRYPKFIIIETLVDQFEE